VQLHFIATTAALAVGAAWTIISATRHDKAVDKCEDDFFSGNTNSTVNDQVSAAGQKMCDIFPWVDVGIMGGLILIIGIMQVSFDFYSRY
jgi:hypothetical protein